VPGTLHPFPVNDALERLLDAHGGVLTRRLALTQVSHDLLDRAVRSGHLMRAAPSVYLRWNQADDHLTRCRAALAYAGPDAIASHLTALALWRLPVPAGGPIHVISTTHRRLGGTTRILVHRCTPDRLARSNPRLRDGIPVTGLERSIVDSWPLLNADEQRAPAIHAVAARMTTPARLDQAFQGTRWVVPGRHGLARLVDLLAAGCRSPLEIWGYESVFAGPGLPDFRRQYPVRLGARTAYLDVFDEVTRVDFELDGAKYHAGTRDRERDLRRDAALTARGITVVRFTHDRLVREPAEVRREVIEILRVRGGRATHVDDPAGPGRPREVSRGG
jgi:very-short-patch-repair endonuclease